MAEPARHLRVVEHDDNGEVIQPSCPDCRRRIDEMAGLEKTIRWWAVKCRELERDKAQEARDHPQWDAAVWLFRYWKRVCNHAQSRWSTDRFWLVEPFLTNEKWGKSVKARLALARLAIDGAAFDAFEVTRKNGRKKRFDGWDKIFESTATFEDFIARAPEAARARCAAIREAEGHRRSR